jgi:hypothetical protein
MSSYTYVLGRKIGVFFPCEGLPIAHHVGTVGSIQERPGLLPKLTVTLADETIHALLPEGEGRGPYYVPLDISQASSLWFLTLQ